MTRCGCWCAATPMHLYASSSASPARRSSRSPGGRGNRSTGSSRCCRPRRSGHRRRVSAKIDDLRAKVLPIVDQTDRAVRALANLAEGLRAPDGELQKLLANLQTITVRMQQGEGTVGRLLADDQVVRQVETILAAATGAVSRLRPILGELEKTSRDVSNLTAAVGGQSQTPPALVRDANATVASLRAIAGDLSKATPALPALRRRSRRRSNSNGC
jgi:ABC-type transporter Mla subunit MlaD